jgi:hypothetical protein
LTSPTGDWAPGAVQLDRRTRMMYDERHVFINGESLRAGGADARLMRCAGRRACASRLRRCSAPAQTRAHCCKTGLKPDGCTLSDLLKGLLITGRPP